MEFCSSIGQDSHRFLTADEWSAQPDRRLILAGVVLPGETPLAGNSDADVILHALTNAISGISGINILGSVADQLCLDKGITDSSVYLQRAIETLGDWQITHLSFSIEGKRPKFSPVIPVMKERLAEMTGLNAQDVGLTATSGEGLTAFGRGEGLQAICIVTARRKVKDEG